MDREFIEFLDIAGKRGYFKDTLTTEGPPGADVVGYDGQSCWDSVGKQMYVCTSAAGGVYTWELEKSGSGGVSFETGNGLELKDGVLSVKTTDTAEPDNTLPITSAGVNTIVGNIGALLDTI